MKKETFIDILIEIRELLLKQKELLTIDEVSAYTGYKKSYIYKLTSQGKITCHKPPAGKKLFFRKSEIDDWLTSTKVKNTIDIQNEAYTEIKKIF